MTSNARSILNDAAYRAQAYARLLGWLLPIITKNFPRHLTVSIACTGLSILCSVSALAIIIDTVTQLQEFGRLTTFPLLNRLGIIIENPEASLTLAVFVVLFFLGAIGFYFGRLIAIGLESHVYRLFYYQTLEYFERDTARTTGIFRLWQTKKALIEKHDIQRLLIADARFVGVIVRLGLFNISHFGNIIVGLGVIIFFAPSFLPLVAAFLLAALVLMYPVNIRATRTTRQLESAAKDRGAEIRERVQAATNKRRKATGADMMIDDELFAMDDDNAELNVVDPQSEKAFDTYLKMVESRLSVLEASRLVMALLVGSGIALVVWLMFSETYAELMTVSSLLVLFLGLRFLLNGVEKVLITMTAMNRYLPYLVRVRDLALDIDNAVAESESSGRPANAVNESAQLQQREPLNWQIDTPSLQSCSGRLAAGDLAVVITPRSGADGIAALFAGLFGARCAVPTGGQGAGGLSDLNQSTTNIETCCFHVGPVASSADAAPGSFPERSAAVLEVVIARTADTLQDALAAVCRIRKRTPMAIVALVSSEYDPAIEAIAPSILLLGDGSRILCAIEAGATTQRERSFINAASGGWAEARDSYMESS